MLEMVFVEFYLSVLPTPLHTSQAFCSEDHVNTIMLCGRSFLCVRGQLS